jgi:phospholipase C
MLRKWKTAAVALSLLAVSVGVAATAASGHRRSVRGAAGTATRIKHLVVIFQENVSFDHYFGTYPHANGLSHDLLTNNPNGVNPRRYSPSNLNDILTCDQDHSYNDEQKAFDGDKMDKFVTTVGNGAGKSPTGQACNANDVMNYYDGKTVTALWNYAKTFSMSDNSFGTTFGPSSPGAINLASGDTGGVDKTINGADTNGDTVPDGKGGRSLIEDAQPYYDDCSTRDAASFSGKNIGDELNAAGLSWGWFQGGFRPTTSFATATAGNPQRTSTFTPDEFKGKFATAPASDQGLCNAVHPVGAAVGGTGGTTSGGTNYGNKDDYIPHHEPFQYYASTANPHHLPPASLGSIGTDTQTTVNGQPQFDTANHQYDMSDFDALVGAINHGFVSPDHLPAVSVLKAPGYQDGHAAYSDPIDEQQFIVREIDALEQTPDWSSTAVVISYDDSDGWYDHVYSGVHNPSNTSGVATPPGPQDFLSGAGLCGNPSDTPLAGQNGRCGYGPRLPLLVISPWAKSGHIDHTLTDQSSIIKFVEDNWGLPRIPGSFDAIAGTLNHLFDFSGRPNKPLYLDPTTGEPVGH